MGKISERLKPLIIKKSKFERPEKSSVIEPVEQENQPMAVESTGDLPNPEFRRLTENAVRIENMPQELQQSIAEGQQAGKQIPVVEIGEVARLKADTYNVATRGKHMHNEIRYSFYNQNNILKAMGYKYDKKAKGWLKCDDSPRAIDLRDAPKHKDKPILIIGSGPTFDEFAPLLKDWEGDTMVSTSQAATCVYLGKEPTYIMALDPNSNYEEMQVDTWKNRKSILIIHPGVDPSLFEQWKGPIYLFRKLQPQTPFYDTVQKVGYSTMGEKQFDTWGFNSNVLIKGQIPMLACVLAAQICAAKQLGYGRQYMVGADMGMPDNRDRFTSWAYKRGKWVASRPHSVVEWARLVKAWDRGDQAIISMSGVPTSIMFIFYSHQIITAWRLTEADIVSASGKGIIKLFPTATPEEIVRKQGAGIKGFNKKKMRMITELYLARQNIYFIYVGNGLMPHEFKDPLHDVPRMLDEIEGALNAQGKGELLDKAANMRRISKLFVAMAKLGKEKPEGPTQGEWMEARERGKDTIDNAKVDETAVKYEKRE